MFCPRCGQQQASEEARFCSRCGLQLDALAEFIEAGGRPGARGAAEELPALTPRQRGTRVGLMILVGGLIFGLIALILTAMKGDFFVLLIPAAFTLTVGVMRILYGLLLEDDSARKKRERRLKKESSKRSAREELREAARGPKRGKPASVRGKELPPQRGVPASVYTGASAETGEMVSPPSVTESTTRLLED
jgi:hypothetical protein